LNNGPALGLWQIEPATHDDLWVNWIRYRPSVANKLKILLGDFAPSAELIDGAVLAHRKFPLPTHLIGNLYYSCAMARIVYRRIPAALPDAGDVIGLSKYWKQWYNTPL